MSDDTRRDGPTHADRPGVGGWRDLPPGYDPFTPRGATGAETERGLQVKGWPLWATVLLTSLAGAALIWVAVAVVLPGLLDSGDEARDIAAEDGARRIEFEIKSWPLGSAGGRYPAETEVGSDDAVGRAMERDGLSWPDNPYTGEPMKRGSDEGDFSYELARDGGDYTFIVHLSGGKQLVIRGDR